MSNKPAILAEGLHKHYGKTHALDGLDLIAEEGTVLGLLGPNGAGKTTAVRILTTLTQVGRKLLDLMSSKTLMHFERISVWLVSMLPLMSTSPGSKIWKWWGGSIIYRVKWHEREQMNYSNNLTWWMHPGVLLRHTLVECVDASI